MSLVKQLAIRAAILMMRILYLPMKKLPVQNKVVMISRQSDTSSIDFRLVEQEIYRQDPNCKVVILSKMLHNPALYVLEILKQMYHMATSRAVLLDSYCIPACVLNHRKELVIVQMWHSIGSMKKFGYAMIGQEEGSSPELAKLMCMHHGYTHILISSYDYLKDYIEGFHTTKEVVKEIPLPRADLLTNPEFLRQRREKIFAKCPWYAAKKNILYCPTFRKQPTELDHQKIQELIQTVDFHRYNLIYKPHSVSELQVNDVRVISSDMNNLDALAIADYVITDYSSMMYEAGLVGLPVYLYAYDWDTYHEKRSFNLDLTQDVPALFTADPAEIMQAIRENRFDAEGFAAFTARNCHMPQTSCREAIVNLLLGSDK